MLFFTEEVPRDIVSESNRYASLIGMTDPGAGPAHAHQWVGLKYEELMAVIGMTITMGVDHRRSVRDYWSTNE